MWPGDISARPLHTSERDESCVKGSGKVKRETHHRDASCAVIHHSETDYLITYPPDISTSRTPSAALLYQPSFLQISCISKVCCCCCLGGISGMFVGGKSYVNESLLRTPLPENTVTRGRCTTADWNALKIQVLLHI